MMVLKEPTISVAAVVLAVSGLFAGMGHAAALQGMPQYKSPAQAQGKLDVFCSKFNMRTRSGQEMCMQETYGQAYTFSRSFSSALGFRPDNYARKRQEWFDKASRADYVAVIGYDRTCSQLLDGVFDPGTTLSFEPSTAVGLPKYCVEEAAELSGRYHVAINRQEADRLEQHIHKLEAYYKRHPDIPDRRPGEKKNIPVRM